MLTHDERRTTDDDERRPLAIGHLSDSGDLKMLTYVYDIQISYFLAWSNQADILIISEKSDLFTSNVIIQKQAWNKLSEQTL